MFKILFGYENKDINISFSVKEERKCRGHGITLAKKQCRVDITTFSFLHRPMKEWNTLSSECVLILILVLVEVICLKIKSTYTERGTFRQVVSTVNKPNGFLVHLPCRVDSLVGNPVNSC